MIEGGGCDPGAPGGPTDGGGGPMGSGGPMPPPPLACCNRSTMELPTVLSAGEIGAKNRLESRPAVGEGMTISVESTIG